MSMFDLTKDNSINSHFNPPEESSIRLEVKFAEALTKNVTVIIYSDFDNCISINQNREIFFDYSI